MRAWGSGPSKLRKRPPASRSNPHADDFDPAPADDHALDTRHREPSVDQLDQKLGLEPVGQHDRLSAAVDGCLKQFERSTALLLRGRHRCAAFLTHQTLDRRARWLLHVIETTADFRTRIRENFSRNREIRNPHIRRNWDCSSVRVATATGFPESLLRPLATR